MVPEGGPSGSARHRDRDEHPLTIKTMRLILLSKDFSYLFTALNPNKTGPSNKGLDKSPRFV